MEIDTIVSNSALYSEFKPSTDHPFLRLKATNVMEAETNDEVSKNQAVSFSLDFTEPPKRRMPRNLSGARNGRQKLSQASMEEKQRLAEERRKKHIDDKLEKIHQLEEEAQRLAQVMVPLIEACNGQPPRKLHGDNDVVTGITTDIVGKSNQMNSQQ